jgi:hypothetical protein
VRELEPEEWSREEREALLRLAETEVDPGIDEERIVRALRRRGLIRPSLPRLRRWMVQATAAAALLGVTFLLGVRYGRNVRPAALPTATPAGEQAVSPRGDDPRGLSRDPETLEDYRDEPDRPGDERILLAKALDR